MKMRSKNYLVQSVLSDQLYKLTAIVVDLHYEPGPLSVHGGSESVIL